MFFAQSDWFLYLGISCTIHLSEQNKMVSRFLSVTEEELFLVNEAAVRNNSKKATKFANKLFKDMYFFYMLAVNLFKMCSKCFVTNDERATSRRSVKLF